MVGADVLAHFVAHEQRALAELRLAGRGERLQIDHAATDTFNDGAMLAWRTLDPVTARAAWGASARQVVAGVTALAEADFDRAGSLAAALTNNTYGHEQSAVGSRRSAVVARCR